jgi:hypothetical protein
VVFQFGLFSWHGCRLLVQLKIVQDPKAKNAKGEIKVYPFSFLNGVHPYFTLPQTAAPTTNQILAIHVGGISPTYNMSYRHIVVFIYTDKTEYAVASFKRLTSPRKSKIQTSLKTSAQTISENLPDM